MDAIEVFLALIQKVMRSCGARAIQAEGDTVVIRMMDGTRREYIRISPKPEDTY